MTSEYGRLFQRIVKLDKIAIYHVNLRNIMQTTVTERGQISIPARLRKKFKLTPGTGIEWMETPEGIFLLPVPQDPIAAFRGQAKSLSTRILLEERRKDRLKDNK